MVLAECSRLKLIGITERRYGGDATVVADNEPFVAVELYIRPHGVKVAVDIVQAEVPHYLVAMACLMSEVEAYVEAVVGGKGDVVWLFVDEVIEVLTIVLTYPPVGRAVRRYRTDVFLAGRSVT